MKKQLLNRRKIRNVILRTVRYLTTYSLLFACNPDFLYYTVNCLWIALCVFVFLTYSSLECLACANIQIISLKSIAGAPAIISHCSVVWGYKDKLYKVGAIWNGRLICKYIIEMVPYRMVQCSKYHKKGICTSV